MNTPLYVKSLSFRLESDNQLAIRGLATNRSDFATPQLRLFISLYDQKNEMLARVGVNLPKVGPFDTAPFEARHRMREISFFTVQLRLEKRPGIDYIDFDSAMSGWGGTATPGEAQSGRITK